MATTTTVTTTYAGDAQKGYISSALFGGETLAGGYFEVKDKIAKTRVMKTLSVSGVIAARTTLFTPVGTIEVGERSITPKMLEVNIQLVKSDFEDDWDSPEMGDSAHKVLPKSFQDAFVIRLAEVVANAIETMIWQGDNTASQFQGILPRMKADAAISAARKLTGVAVTAANVITELTRVKDAIPVGVRRSKTAKIFVAPNIQYAFIDALGGFGASGQGANGVEGLGVLWYEDGRRLSISGLELVGLAGIPEDHMAVIETDKAWFGTDLLSDTNEVKLLDQSDVTGDDVVNCIMKFSGDTNYAVSADVVYYGITV